jgi:hypothetical protein
MFRTPTEAVPEGRAGQPDHIRMLYRNIKCIFQEPESEIFIAVRGHRRERGAVAPRHEYS